MSVFLANFGLAQLTVHIENLSIRIFNRRIITFDPDILHELSCQATFAYTTCCSCQYCLTNSSRSKTNQRPERQCSVLSCLMVNRTSPNHVCLFSPRLQAHTTSSPFRPNFLTCPERHALPFCTSDILRNTRKMGVILKSDATPALMLRKMSSDLRCRLLRRGRRETAEHTRDDAV